MQDQAFVEIGKIALAEIGNKEPYQLFIQNMFPDKDNYKIILPVFNITEDGGVYKCHYKNIDIQNVNKDNYLKYGYRKGSSRGGDVTFTTKFGDIDKKLKTLVDNQFKVTLKRLKDKSHLEYKILKATHEYLQVKEYFNSLKAELSDIYGSLSKDEKVSSGLSLLFVVNGQEKYIADFEVVQEILSSSGNEGKSKKYSVTSSGKDAMCSICLKEKAEVYGFASPFKYSTVDKPGMVSGFFNQANNWKNYPICSDCSLHFELGRSYVVNNLNSYFYGKSYYIIPKTLLSKDKASLKKALIRLKDLYSDLSKTGIIKRKEDLLEKYIAQESEDYYNVNLLFYEENTTTKAIKIKLLLEEILPSRFRKLFIEVPSVVNENSLYKKALKIKKEFHDLVFNLGILKTFFEDDLYNLIHDIFMLKRFSEEALYGRFMTVIRSNYNKMQTSSSGYTDSTWLTILKAHLTLAYLRQLNLIENYSPEFIMETIEQEPHKSSFNLEKLTAFINENKSFLNTESKTGVFAVGILVRLVLNTQYANLKSTPFEKKLKGYNLNADLLKNIYMEALNKLSQYQGFYAYSNLREIIDKYFLLNVEKIQRLSNNELSFYFVAGVEFGGMFKNEEVETQKNTI